MTEAERARMSRRVLNASHHHDDAMRLADWADTSMRQGDRENATRLRKHALVLERQAADLVAPYLDFEPSRSVLHRSAAALAIECGEFTEASRLIEAGLSGKPPAEIADELLELQGKVATQEQNNGGSIMTPDERATILAAIRRYETTTGNDRNDAMQILGLWLGSHVVEHNGKLYLSRPGWLVVVDLAKVTRIDAM